MKNVLLFIMMMISFDVVIAQEVTENPPKEVYQLVYCVIVATQKLFSTKVIITVDYGESKKLFTANTIKDETGKVASFNSVIDALNYMAQDDWELAQAYIVTVNNQNVYHYLLQKWVLKQ